MNTSRTRTGGTQHSIYDAHTHTAQWVNTSHIDGTHNHTPITTYLHSALCSGAILVGCRRIDFNTVDVTGEMNKRRSERACESGES